VTSVLRPRQHSIGYIGYWNCKPMLFIITCWMLVQCMFLTMTSMQFFAVCWC